MEARDRAGKHGALLGTGIVADRDDMGELSPASEHVLHARGLVGGNIDADLLHGLNHERIQRASSPALLAVKNSGHAWLRNASAIWLRALL